MVHTLIEAFRYRGCPICQILDQDEYDFMCQWQHRTFMEEKTREDLVSAKGYCNFHFYEMARLTSPLVNAVVVKDLIDKEVEEIEKGAIPSPGKIDCPVCRYVGQKEEVYLREFTTLLQDDAIQKKYEGTDGLCRVHMKKILYPLEGNELGQFVLRTQLSQLKNLKEELQNFISKGGRGSREMGREKNSWWIAVKKMVGKKGLGELDSF